MPEVDDLRTAGDDLASVIRELRDEYGPEDHEDDDLGWLEVERVLRRWQRVKESLSGVSL